MTDLPSLVTAAQQGDHTAFGQIVSRFQDMAYASAYAIVGDAMLAQDVTQEAFFDAWLNLGKLHEPAAFPGWFRRIVMGKGHRQIRGKGTLLIALEDVGSLYLPVTENSLEESLDLRQTMQAALNSLPEAQRLALVLFYSEGYSYKEIAAYLEASVSTVKKRLFDGRKQLHKRMIPMVQQTLQSNKPSQDSEFAHKVQFFVALRDNNLEQIKRLLRQQPTLNQATTEWQMALGQYYWPLGSTATHLAAASGFTQILAYLLDQGAPLDQGGAAFDPVNRSGLTPLHLATLLRQPAALRLLIERGANINATTETGQSALHQAVMRESSDLVGLLLENHADPNLADKAGRTPLDWAMIRQNQALVDLLTRHGAQARNVQSDFAKTSLASKPAPERQQWLGRIVDGQGKPLDGGGALPLLQRAASSAPTSPIAPSLLTSGLKIIDLLAPLPRGGQIGIFTPLSGVGLVVLLGQLVYSVHALHGGSTVWLLMESDTLRATDQTSTWREVGVDDKMVFVAGKRADSPAQKRQTVETALAIAEALHRKGGDVLLLVDSQFAAVEGVTDFLRQHNGATATSAITTIYHGHHTVGVEPEIFAGLDALITFDYQRAKQRLYPAIDPVRSTSKLLQSDIVSAAQRHVAAESKRLLQRYADLRAPMDNYKMGIDALWYIEDDPNLAHEITRARKLDRFFTQPFYGAEPWSGVVGTLITLEDTLAGCRAIVEGTMDDTPEEPFYFAGGLAEVRERAK